jgi:chromatin segregation and condensation protein Rec8/ScpA/Scc1 (kleisin family)
MASELLALRARLDLEQARDREAALQLDAALRAALAELEGWRELDGMPERLEELRSLLSEVALAAEEARSGALEDTGRGVVERTLGRLEAALRARTAGAQF